MTILYHILKWVDFSFQSAYGFHKKEDSIYSSLHPEPTAQNMNIQFSSVTQSCLTICDPMDCSTPGFPVHHQLPVFTQTHVHWVSDAIQPSHPLSSPSPTFNISLHLGLFQWVSFSHQVARVLDKWCWGILDSYSGKNKSHPKPHILYKSKLKINNKFLCKV